MYFHLLQSRMFSFSEEIEQTMFMYNFDYVSPCLYTEPKFYGNSLNARILYDKLLLEKLHN